MILQCIPGGKFDVVFDITFVMSQGIGRRVLTRQGWREGRGLGPRHAGMADALENDGQTSKDKKGLG